MKISINVTALGVEDHVVFIQELFGGAIFLFLFQISRATFTTGFNFCFLNVVDINLKPKDKKRQNSLRLVLVYQEQVNTMANIG